MKLNNRELTVINEMRLHFLACHDYEPLRGLMALYLRLLSKSTRI